MYNIVSEPVVYPVTLTEVKSWLRVDDSNSDTLLRSVLQAATKVAEQWLNRPLIARQYDLTMDDFPEVIRISKLPVSAVDSVKYYDTDNVEQTLSSSLYKVSLGSKYADCRIRPAVNQSWPNIYDDLDAVTVRFTCGYGVADTDIPHNIKTGILYLCASMFDARCYTEEFNMNESPTAKALFASERLPFCRV